MTRVVVDASFVVAWLMNERPVAEQEQILGRIMAQGAVVPLVFTLEIANVLVMAARRGIGQRTIDRAIASLWELPLDIDKRTSDLALTRVFKLATRHGLTAYDAAYLELATRRGDVLVTMDHALASAAKGEGLLVLSQ